MEGGEGMEIRQKLEGKKMWVGGRGEGGKEEGRGEKSEGYRE